MKRIVSILIGIVVTGLAAHAQVEHGGEVTLLEFDGKTALFAAEGISAKKGDILRSKRFLTA